MKSYRDEAKAGQARKIASFKTGVDGTRWRDDGTFGGSPKPLAGMEAHPHETQDNPTRACGGRLDKPVKRQDGGRVALASGGKAKGKTVVNVHIDASPKPPPMMPPPAPPPMPAGPPPGPPPMPPMGGMMPPMGGMGAAMPPAAAGMRPPMPMRAAGGKVVRTPADMTAGALSGPGRLQKKSLQEHSKK
jgi:hypothetical protein